MANILGFQSEVINDSVLDQYRDSQAAVFKPINAVDRRLYQRYRDEVGGWIFPRIWDDSLPITSALPQTVADLVCRQLDPVHDLVDATFFLNEREETYPSDLAALNGQTVEYCRIMGARGYNVIVGSLGVGNPANPADVVKLADAMRAGWAWEYHAYSAPNMQQDPADYVLRYRTMRAALEAMNDPSVLKPLFLGEVGVDGGVLGPDHKEQGYQSFPAFPYLPQLQWADGEFQKDPYVLCAAVFGLSMTARWARFDVAGRTDILAWLAGQGKPSRRLRKVDYQKAIWDASPNYGYPMGASGRLGHAPVAIVDHVEQGTETGTDQWFANPASQVSAHYSVAKDGTVRQHVLESNAAWANGTDPSLGVARYRPDLSIPWIADCFGAHPANCNAVTISIEHEGVSGEPLTEPQYQATLNLHRDIFQRHGWPVETGRIVGHFQVNAVDKPFCPGPAYPFTRLYADLKAALNPAPPIDVRDLSVFPGWALARLQHGQDFRGTDGLAAFRAMLSAIGCDASNPGRYGAPGY